MVKPRFLVGLCAQRGGLLLTRARLGDIVDEGEHLCSIVNIYGDEVETITAPARGVFADHNATFAYLNA